MAYEIEEVSCAVVTVFREFANKYPDRLRLVLKDLEWRDEAGNWQRITSWDNFDDYGDNKACKKCGAEMFQGVMYSDKSDNPRESPIWDCSNKACGHYDEIEEEPEEDE